MREIQNETMSTPTFPLQQPDPEIAFSAALAAFEAGFARPEDVRALSDLSRDRRRRLGRAWPDLAVQVRRDIAETMGSLQQENVDLLFGRAFRVALEDDDAVVRQRAVSGLWEDVSSDLEATLLDLVQSDPSTDVRAEAAHALGRFAQRAVEQDGSDDDSSILRATLLRIAEDETQHELLRCQALEALGVFGGADVASLIESAYASDEPSLMTAAVSAMGRSRRVSWLESVVAVLEDEDIELRETAASACGAIGDAAAIADLAAAALDPEHAVRVAALNSLAAIGGKAAIRVLETAANDEDYADRDAASAALNRLNDDTMLA